MTFNIQLGTMSVNFSNGNLLYTQVAEEFAKAINEPAKLLEELQKFNSGNKLTEKP